MSISEELIAAIRDRLAAGNNKSEIKTEAIAAGHSEEIFEAAFVLAKQEPDSVEEIPSSSHLWREGWKFVLKNWKLVAAVAIPLAVFGVGDILAEAAFEGYVYIYVSAVLGIMSVVIYLIGFMVALRLLSGKVTNISEALKWSRQHFWSFLCVYVLVSLVVLGGYVLFLIPGIIAAFTLYFAVYIAVFEEVKGEQALIRSRKLVKGKWWLLVRKLVAVNLYNLLIIISFVLGSSVILAFASTEIPSHFSTLITVALSQLFGVSVAFMLASVGTTLYKNFTAQQIQPMDEINPTRYRFLGAVGLLAFLALIALALLATANPDFVEEEFSYVTERPAEQLDEIASFAGAFSEANDGVYGAFCDLLATSDEGKFSQECNATSSAWAVVVTISDERWCIDSTGYRKQAATRLEDRTRCLPF